ncbi:hypothetical protein [Enterovibrio calviensis]|uniref:hypothetical protein n=1 Tax=Enterovibrio calviensis TaxID=91359 RepID=UPI00048A1BEC|nr:hypothetical protein [Enterovibrio calviensis]
MKKIIIAVGMMLASSTAFAGAMNSGVDMRVTTAGQGAWAQLMKNGEPVKGATITLSGELGTYVTPENGRVFVMTSAPQTRTGVFTAMLTDGQEIERSVVIPRDH